MENQNLSKVELIFNNFNELNEEDKNKAFENDSSFESKESSIRFDGDSDEDESQKEENEEDYLIYGEENFIPMIKEENLVKSAKK